MDFVSVKYALEGMPPLVLVPVRYVLAGSLLLALLRFSGRGAGIVWRDLPLLFGLGLVGVALNQIGYTAGLGLTSGSNGALIFATAPIWGLLLGVALHLERASWRSASGLGLAVTGVALIVGGGLGSPEASVAGDLLVCLSALSWGAYTVLSLPVLRRHDPLLVAGWTMLLGGAAVIPFALTGLYGLSDPLGSVNWVSVGPVSWTAVAYSTLLASGFAIAAWQTNVSRIGANKVLVYMYVVTLVGLVASIVLLGEGLGPGKILGASVILLGVYLARRA
ncbi:EamA family transporter [Rubrobacter tropicus]|uniref:EamA family transporter n=2 Tax=Rubrobacter tropicus TaxID=2653851 RepID=A0A6G8QEW4_9ACTN|nr:EamA family transporter [Rubrobacter tropicus]